jgi:hypothetical protein
MSTTKMLIDPPTDVQSAVSAVLTACRNWLPTEVSIPASTRPLTPTSPRPSLFEAAVCGNVVLDIQSPTRDCNAFVRRHHALANLSLNEVHRLRDLLSEAIIVAESADARQPGLWSETTTRAVAYRLGRGGRA